MPLKFVIRALGGIRRLGTLHSNNQIFLNHSFIDTKTSVAGENFENTDLLSAEMDPFVPHETILSKYSVMIYTSANSKKTFHELKDAKFCASCGEKVSVHRLA